MYSEEGPGRAAAPPSPLLAVPNVTAHPSTASVPITVLLYNGSMPCGFNVSINGLSENLSSKRADDKIIQNTKELEQQNLKQPIQSRRVSYIQP